MPHDLNDTLPGKMSICWKCGSEFILDDANMLNSKPICADCNPTIKSMGDLLNQFGVK
jgi:formylmethanofuran dehydrogenase subunit E